MKYSGIQKEKFLQKLENIQNEEFQTNGIFQSSSTENHPTSPLIDIQQNDQFEKTGDIIETDQIKKNTYKCLTIDNNIITIILKTELKKENEDLLFYLINVFNCEQDNFSAIIVTKDSKYLQHQEIKKDKILISASTHTKNQQQQQQLRQIYKQMVVFGFFFDQFVINYLEYMWKPEYQGDDDLFDNFVELAIHISEEYIQQKKITLQSEIQLIQQQIQQV